MIKADFHMHTSFSVDGAPEATMDAMANRAVELGLSEIAFTDHVDYMPDGGITNFHIDYKEYIIHFNHIKEKYSNKLRVALGVEIGVAPHVTKQTREFAASYPFEFIIASTHDVQKCELYVKDNEFFRNRSKFQAYSIYFEEILHNVKTNSFFSVYGHLDYIPRYGIYKDNSLDYDDFKYVIDEILTELVSRGKGLEINTSGYAYGLNAAHPQTKILKAYKRLGGEIITVGSDAHSPKRIAADFDKAEDALRQADFKAYTVFRDGKPYWIDL
ncbi:MAG: histidinol-phosphatase HisJ family protein [Clostridiales bacterium]|jgi:histidinol-phosphatase (PHP family)|nr:histidinol-phosphatase HisJ family protein [Clostridiales bacterium]